MTLALPDVCLTFAWRGLLFACIKWFTMGTMYICVRIEMQTHWCFLGSIVVKLLLCTDMTLYQITLPLPRPPHVRVSRITPPSALADHVHVSLVYQTATGWDGH